MRSKRERIDYFAGLYEDCQEEIELQSGKLVIERLGLGKHFRLQALGRKIGEATLGRRVSVLRVWLLTAGIEPEQLTLSDLLVVVRAVQELNRSRGHLAWDALPPSDIQEQVTDYPGRALARIVDTLARHYGWDLEHILALPPEVALAHAQECVLARQRCKEWEYSLSEIAWEYDERSKKSKYRPLPPLPWEALPTEHKHEPVPQVIIDKYYPKGVIIDLTDERAKHTGA